MGGTLGKDIETGLGDYANAWGHVIGDTFKGVTGGGFDYHNVGVDFENYGNDFHQLIKGNADLSVGRRHYATSYAQQQAAQWAKVLGEGAINDNSGAPQGGNSNPFYGQSVGNDNVKPSDLAKIANPQVKMGISASRGVVRSTLNNVGKSADNSAASQLASGPSAKASNNTNSAGGVGAPSSVDVGDTQHS